MAEISVIVPVFKAEKYLAQCVESILDQTFSDLEVILVDDGSPDRCGEICEEYAEKDNRVTVIHQKNQGQAAARNHALEKSSAPWVCFVDSDDLIHPKTLELLYRAAEESGVPMAMAQMLEAPSLPEDFFDPREGEYRVLAMDDGTLARMYDDGTYPAWVSCCKLIRRDLIESHPFCPGRVFEDNEAVCHWIVAAGKLAYLSENLYFYRTNPESTTQSTFSIKKLDFLWALENIVKCYADAGFAQTYRRFLDRYISESAGYYRVIQYDLRDRKRAGSLKKDLRRVLRRECCRLTKGQREDLLDAMHPRLIKFYWPVEGLCRTFRREGLSGICRKLGNHLGKEKQP